MKSTVQVFTSAALNYIPKVRILFKSLQKYHPDWTFNLLLIDKIPENFCLNDEDFKIITSVADLEIRDFVGWSFCHTITELSTAAKPWMLQKLLLNSGSGGKVIYLDPDTVVFSPLTEITNALDESSILLTPHQVTPELDVSAIIDNEICSLKHGIYNLGFIAVKNSPVGNKFAKWWTERTYYFCRDDIPNGLFTDQKWIDLVPALFPEVAILLSTRYNVATWNITTRHLSLTENGSYLVDGLPLGFYHFTGFDSGNHFIMAAKNGANNFALTKLISWYNSEVELLKKDPLTQSAWHFGFFESGNPISKDQRIVYRARRDLQTAFPDPYVRNGFEEWWNNQAKIEYPQLFDKETNANAIKKLTTPLVPGYIGSSSLLPLGRSKLIDFICQTTSSPIFAYNLFRRSWHIIRQVGVTGLRSKFKL